MTSMSNLFRTLWLGSTVVRTSDV